MKILNTNHKRKSAIITTILLMLLIFCVFNYGMTYLDPPEEYGLAINFGNSTVGSGEPVNKEFKPFVEKKSTPEIVEKQEVVEEKVQNVSKETPKKTIKEEIITSDASDFSVIKKVKKVKEEQVKEVIEKEVEVEKPVKKVVEKREIVEEKVKENVKKEISKEQPKPSKETQDALNNLLNGNSSDEKPKGEGDDKEAGVKGKEKGDANSSKYYGNTANGSGGNYNLAGRRALSKPKEQPNCEEEGTVVVRIQVDKNGKVINAQAGVKGTTNSAPCLLKPAKEAALRTKWNSDNKAPSKQVGTIIYKFSLSK